VYGENIPSLINIFIALFIIQTPSQLTGDLPAKIDIQLIAMVPMEIGPSHLDSGISEVKW
jgi:hypothetical protein